MQKDLKVPTSFSPLICTYSEDPWCERNEKDEVEWKWPQTTNDVCIVGACYSPYYYYYYFPDASSPTTTFSVGLTQACPNNIPSVG